MTVHRELGHGFLEAVYQEALEIELIDHNIPFQREVFMPVMYKGTLLQKNYIADFICYSKIILEVKALKALDSSHEAQMLNYLKATNFKLGLLINFGSPSLEYKRMVYDTAK
ncbi:MAG: GxxExxY protein [Cyclobacteriaceae bacterium]|nr:GxxExxY protein [Cyclobacteriaceae bacterium]